MLRTPLLTMLLAGLFTLAGPATADAAERAIGKVVDRTRNTVVLRHEDGRTRSYVRGPDLKVRGENERWRDIDRGDFVKVRFDRNRGKRVLDRVRLVGHDELRIDGHSLHARDFRDRDGRRHAQTERDRRTRHFPHGHRDHVHTADCRAAHVRGEVTWVTPWALHIVTDDGRNLRLRVSQRTALEGAGQHGILRHCDRVKVVFERDRDHGVATALHVSLLGGERYSRLRGERTSRR